MVCNTAEDMHNSTFEFDSMLIFGWCHADVASLSSLNGYSCFGLDDQFDDSIRPGSASRDRRAPTLWPSDSHFLRDVSSRHVFPSKGTQMVGTGIVV